MSSSAPSVEVWLNARAARPSSSSHTKLRGGRGVWGRSGVAGSRGRCCRARLPAPGAAAAAVPAISALPPAAAAPVGAASTPQAAPQEVERDARDGVAERNVEGVQRERHAGVACEGARGAGGHRRSLGAARGGGGAALCAMHNNARRGAMPDSRILGPPARPRRLPGDPSYLSGWAHRCRRCCGAPGSQGRPSRRALRGRRGSGWGGDNTAIP
jgi:hypothetical protein